MKAGDRVIVTSPLSSFYGRKGTILAINFLNDGGRRTPFGFYVDVDGYSSPSGFGTPFMETEIRPLDQETASPFGRPGGSNVVLYSPPEGPQ